MSKVIAQPWAEHVAPDNGVPICRIERCGWWRAVGVANALQVLDDLGGIGTTRRCVRHQCDGVWAQGPLDARARGDESLHDIELPQDGRAENRDPRTVRQQHLGNLTAARVSSCAE